MIDEGTFGELANHYPVLLDLPAPLQAAVRDQGHSLQFPPEHVAFDVGSPCTGYLLLSQGILRVTKFNDSGCEILLYRVQPGESCILTVSCLVDNRPYTARGVFETEARAVTVHQRLFLKLVDESAAFRQFIFAAFGERVVQLMELVEEVTFGKLEQRLATLLLAKGARIQITHQKLADEMGSTREAVSRILGGFAAQGALRVERGEIDLLDLNLMHRLAGVCAIEQRRYAQHGHKKE